MEQIEAANTVFAGGGTIQELLASKDRIAWIERQLAVGATLELFFHRVRVAVRKTKKVQLGVTDSQEGFVMVFSKERGKHSRTVLNDESFMIYDEKGIAYIVKHTHMLPLHSALLSVLPTFKLSLGGFYKLVLVKADRNALAHPRVDNELLSRLRKTVPDANEDKELANALISVFEELRTKNV